MSTFQTIQGGIRSGPSRSAALALGAAVALVLLATPAAAQLTGQLAGEIRDSDGAPLPGASVTVNSPNLMGSRTDFTDADGEFRFASLPPGFYTVQAELDGFIPQGRSEVQVRVGRVTELGLDLAVGEFREEVTVVAETPVIDPEQVSTSQTFTAEYLKKAAIGTTNRSYQAILNRVGGVAGGSNPNVYGSTSGENAFLIDGVDTTDPVTATFNINMNFNAIQEVNFETGGFEARYGRATGGVVNVITKSGGNSYSGSIDHRYRDNGFYRNGEHFDKDAREIKFRETEANLGGPFQRDKLWFYVAANPVLSESTPMESATTRKFDGTYLLGKLTWQARDNWQVTGRWLDEDTTIANSNAARGVAAEAASHQEQPKSISNLEALALPTSNLQWHIRASLVRGELNSFPQSRDLDTIGHIDSFGDGSRSVNYTNQQYSDRNRDEFSTNLAWFVDEVAGDHEFRVGVDTSKSHFRGENNPTGGGYYFQDRNRQPYTLMYQPLEQASEFDGDLLTAYLQDTWRINPRLTVKLGLRHDQVAFTNDDDDDNEVADMNKLQPRLGIAWDITGDAKTVARASWGRFMHPNALTMPSFARVNNEPSIRYLSCSWPWFQQGTRSLGSACRTVYSGERRIGNRTIPNWIPDPVSSNPFDPNGWFYNRTFASEPSVIADDLKPTYADQIIVGVERELARRTSLTLTYVEKETRDIFEDTCNGNLPTPKADADCDYYVMANLPILARDYRGVILTLESRFADWIWLIASYTNSESKGNIGYTQNSGTAFDVYPDHFTNRYGYMGDDRRHRVKINGYVDLPLGFTLGFDGYWSSPGVYTPTRAAEDAGYGRILDEPRGSRRFAKAYGMDLQVAKGFDFGDRLRLELIGAVYNVLNDEQPTGVCTRVEGCAGGFKLHETSSWSSPQRYEAGVRFEF